MWVVCSNMLTGIKFVIRFTSFVGSFILEGGFFPGLWIVEFSAYALLVQDAKGSPVFLISSNAYPGCWFLNMYLYVDCYIGAYNSLN